MTAAWSAPAARMAARSITLPPEGWARERRITNARMASSSPRPRLSTAVACAASSRADLFSRLMAAVRPAPAPISCRGPFWPRRQPAGRGPAPVRPWPDAGAARRLAVRRCAWRPAASCVAPGRPLAERAGEDRPCLDAPLDPAEPRLTCRDSLRCLAQPRGRVWFADRAASVVDGDAQPRPLALCGLETLHRAGVHLAAARRSCKAHRFLRTPSVKVARGRRARTACDQALPTLPHRVAHSSCRAQERSSLGWLTPWAGLQPEPDSHRSATRAEARSLRP